MNRSIISLLLCGGMFLFCSGHCLSQGGAQAQQQTTVIPTRFSVQKSYTSEGTYQHIAVDGSALRYTYNQRNSLEKPGDIGTMMRQAPYWTKQDLVTEKVTLSANEVAALKQKITLSGFMALKGAYGDLKGRAYSTVIAVRLNGKSKIVDYRSGLRGGPMPRAFKTVDGELIQLVNRHSKHKIPVY